MATTLEKPSVFRSSAARRPSGLRCGGSRRPALTTRAGLAAGFRGGIAHRLMSPPAARPVRGYAGRVGPYSSGVLQRRVHERIGCW